MSCDICGEVPRAFWTIGGHYWRRVFGDQLCPGCWFWAARYIGYMTMMEAEQ